MQTLRLLALALLVAPSAHHESAERPAETSAFARALSTAERALDSRDHPAAETALRSAFERDAKSVDAWGLESRLAAALGDRDREIYALHRELALRIAQGHDRAETIALRSRIVEIDPLASKLFGLRTKYVGRFQPIAERYEKQGWPHAAISVHKEILALDPENTESPAAIERLASAPDPSLAADAKPADLMADVSAEWVAEHDASHAVWKTRSVLERDNYITETSAGYEVMIRAAEAMEQMNAFYREFFDYGTDGKGVPRIVLRIFNSKDEYQEFGTGPPVEWSAGQFTGGAVETYTGGGGFRGMTGTLFHEAAHQFVALATNAAGWLNEGLASFFEGCQILSNGTVLVNRPASHRLFPLVARMKNGWMSSASDGISADDPSVTPMRAPTFRIVIENQYAWGPPWYAPTWGVVYFLFNYQDPVDGRFVYRSAFREYINRSGGLSGNTAVEKFEEVVLGNPSRVTAGVTSDLELPRTIDELSATWRKWLVNLQGEQTGLLELERPYLEWARNAIARGDTDDAAEFFEKGLVESADDPDLCIAFGEFLAEAKNADRAVKLFRHARRLLTEAKTPTKEIDRWLRKLDSEFRKLEELRTDLIADAVALPLDYLDAERELMAMDVSWRLGVQLGIPELLTVYERAVERQGHSLAQWRLAYNESDLGGWNPSERGVFTPEGPKLSASFDEYRENRFEYRFLTLDEITSGDFSIEAEVQVVQNQVAFAGLVFGQKSGQDFHALILFPPSEEKRGFADLASFYGGAETETWRHEPVMYDANVGEDTAGRWYRLRIDVTGRVADMWVNDEHVSTQEFGTRDVLAGNFGLITGVGLSRFRNVRYLARDPRDPSGRIERELRVAAVEASGTVETSATGDSVDESKNGSWIGLRPPFPTGAKWLQNERSSWNEAYGSPQLLVLWSCDQNESVEIDRWLGSVAERFADVDLCIVNVVQTWDDGRVQDYLEEHPFPGTIAIDARSDSGTSGVMFDACAIDRFFLPRLLLIDVDGRVVWEGDPGFRSGVRWDGEQSFLNTPLENLVYTRKLKELASWRERWNQIGAPALAESDLDTAFPILVDSRKFEPEGLELVAEAQRKLDRVEAVLDAFESTADELEALGREPALIVLREWGALLGKPIDFKRNKSRLTGGNVKDWDRAKSFLKGAIRRAEEGKEVKVPSGVLDKLVELDGAFVQELTLELRAAEGDSDRLAELCTEAANRPRRWLGAEYFGW